MINYPATSDKIASMPKKTKANDRKDVSVRLSIETYEKVERLAAIEDRSISNFIARIVEQYVAMPKEKRGHAVAVADDGGIAA